MVASADEVDFRAICVAICCFAWQIVFSRHHKAEEYLDAYLEAAELRPQPKTPLLRSTRGRTSQLTEKGLSRVDAFRIVQRRAKDAGLLNIPVVTKEFATEVDALEYAISSQRNRRNLTEAEMFSCIHELDKRKSEGRPPKTATGVAVSGRSSEQTAKLLKTSAAKSSPNTAIPPNCAAKSSPTKWPTKW